MDGQSGIKSTHYVSFSYESTGALILVKKQHRVDFIFYHPIDAIVDRRALGEFDHLPAHGFLDFDTAQHMSSDDTGHMLTSYKAQVRGRGLV